ncbi:MAG: aldo/keto reductase [Kiritimatiellae bacterium]|nr:aldo/keto reductase [Kiritimatiellia bacterium]
MLYRTLGKTGLSVSQLGFGAMRMPMQGSGEAMRVDRALALPMLRRAFDLGVNYFDTAVGYCNQDSQRVVGEALQGVRDRVVVSTKNPEYGEDERAWWHHLENSLERLRTDYIDVYNHHGLSWQTWVDAVEPRVAKWMVRARDQGLVRHIGFSFHDVPSSLSRLIRTGYASVVTVQYNLLDRQLEEAISEAHAAGIGVVVMGPVAGGRLGDSSAVLGGLVPGIERVPELALRFVLSNPHVSVALSGMSTLAMVEENVRTGSDRIAMRETDRVAITAHMERLRKLASLYCTGCGYCQPCPHEVAIPRIFEYFNRGRVYGLWGSARAGYAATEARARATACVKCGECEAKCPQHIAIRKQLDEADEALRQTGADGAEPAGTGGR